MPEARDSEKPPRAEENSLLSLHLVSEAVICNDDRGRTEGGYYKNALRTGVGVFVQCVPPQASINLGLFGWS